MNHKVFLSFATEDKSLVDKFRMQAHEQSLPFDFQDYSVKDTFDKSWKSQAEKIIHGSSVTLCFVGQRTYQSEPVNWEIQRSIELGKPVVAIHLGDEKLLVPRALREHSITPLPWNLEEIMQAIENAAA